MVTRRKKRKSDALLTTSAIIGGSVAGMGIGAMSMIGYKALDDSLLLDPLPPSNAPKVKVIDRPFIDDFTMPNISNEEDGAVDEKAAADKDKAAPPIFGDVNVVNIWRNIQEREKWDSLKLPVITDTKEKREKYSADMDNAMAGGAILGGFGGLIAAARIKRKRDEEHNRG